MNRTFVAVLAAAAMLAAATSFAVSTHADLQSADPVALPVSGGAGVATTVSPGQAQATLTGDEQQVTGEVVMVTPSEITLHTSSGMKRFEVTPQTQETLSPVEGETVTLYYVPGEGSARASVINEASATPTGASQDVQAAPATPAEAPAAVSTVQPEGPTMAAEATTPEPPSSSAGAADATPRVTRLPRTASATPLIGLAGLLALTGAAVLRLAVRA